MNFAAYEQRFLDILLDTNPGAPYDDAHYLDYVRLNWSRQQRWLKTGLLNDELTLIIQAIPRKQYWTIITEPWCGDAAHSLPFLHRLAELNPLITVDYQLRDSEPFLIENYLTGISRSIPKLIIADSNKKDIAVWGPRPAGCQLLFEQLIATRAEVEQKKISLQQWYNLDKGVSLQQELTELYGGITML
jgi:hypothetical protein